MKLSRPHLALGLTVGSIALLAYALFGDSDGVEWIGSVLGAMLVLYLYRMMTSRRGVHA